MAKAIHQYVPFVSSSAPAFSVCSPEANYKATSSTKPRVLLVEDDIIIQKVHACVLEKMGCQVEIAGNGQEVLAKHAANQYDLIVLDGGLPDTTGFELGKIIRQRESEKTYRTPLILLSGWHQELLLDQCASAGIDEFAIKPVPFKTLESMVGHWLPMVVSVF